MIKIETLHDYMIFEIFSIIFEEITANHDDAKPSLFTRDIYEIFIAIVRGGREIGTTVVSE